MKKLLLLLLILPVSLRAQDSSVPPSALKLSGNKIVNSQMIWERQARGEWLDIYAEQIYGVVPKVKVKTKYDVEQMTADTSAARRKSINITFSANGKEHSALMLLDIPNNIANAPVIFGLCFSPLRELPDTIADPAQRKTAEKMRQIDANQWQLDYLLSRGYAVARVYAGDFYPDREDGYAQSVGPMLYEGDNTPQEQRAEAFGLWAWGLSRAMDYLQSDKDIDSRRVILFGHSRMGKTALWASACDTRFFATLLNESGCGGASLFRDIPKHERIGDLNRKFPHWLNGNAKKYAGKESELPIDQNIILSLIAPRPLYIGSAVDDTACDHERQYAAMRLTDEVYGGIYRLTKPLPEAEPELNTPFIEGVLGYHIRDGRHDVTRFDWQCYLDFVDMMRGVDKLVLQKADILR